MKSHRLLSVLLLLQAYGRLSGRELARRLEVSERTVHRDMEALSASGVPVFALRGARGGWQLDEQWRTQVPGLEPAELRALLLAQPRVLGDTRLSGAAERAMGKILAALPANLRDHAALLRQRLYVDTAGWRGGNESLSMLNVVQDAVARDRKLSMLYRHEGESAERLVDPLGLVAKGSAWYLVALTPRGLRTYRVSRIERADVLDVAAERPRGLRSRNVLADVDARVPRRDVELSGHAAPASRGRGSLSHVVRVGDPRRKKAGRGRVGGLSREVRFRGERGAHRDGDGSAGGGSVATDVARPRDRAGEGNHSGLAAVILHN